MSLTQVKSVIQKFVQNDRNDLLTIKGNWGVGKTFFWRKTVEKFSNQGVIGHKNYSYVSLFGIDSLETLKNSIIANQIISTAIGKEINLSASVLYSRLKNILKNLERIPYIKNYSGGLVNELAFQYVKDSLVCFDDLERRSNKFDIKDILGLASFLKEQRNCKIVFILNDEKLLNRETFDENNEKVVDIEVNFAPLAEETFGYVFKQPHPYFRLVELCCLTLKITNIRILQRIDRFIEDLIPYLIATEQIVAEDAIRSIILFVWCHYNKEIDTPTLEFVDKYTRFGRIFDKHLGKETPSEDNKWYDILELYGYEKTDELDKILMSFVKNGFLDKGFSEKIKIKNQEITNQNGVNKYREAWRLYNNSFKNNEKEFIEQLFSGFRSNMKYLDIRNLDETLFMLRQFDADEEANTLTNEFIETCFDNELVNLVKRGSMGYNVEDSYLKEKLNQKLNEAEEKRTLKEVLEKFSSNNQDYFEDIKFLATVTADDFYNYYKSFEPAPVNNEIQFYLHDLYHQVKTCLDFAEARDEPYKTIGTNVKNAIIRIALDSRINKSRIMRWFGISEEEIEQARESNKELS